MEKNRERKNNVLSQDFSLFDDSEAGDETWMDTSRETSMMSFDMSDDEEETTTDEGKEATEGKEASSEDETSKDWDDTKSEETGATESEDESKDESKDASDEVSKNSEELNSELDQLFEDISASLDEVSSKTNDESVRKIVDDLRETLSTKEMELQKLQRENEVLYSKYLDSVWEATDMGMYKSVIDKLESNPKMMMFVKYFGNKDDERITNKLTQVASDFIYELTGTDISDAIESSSKDIIKASLWGKWSGWMPNKSPEEDTSEMGLHDSISKFF